MSDFESDDDRDDKLPVEHCINCGAPVRDPRPDAEANLCEACE